MATILQTGFKFNLLPPPPKEEVELQLEREDSITYAIVLIFVAAVIYFGLVLVSTFVTDPRLKQANTAIDNREEQVESYSNIKSLHGELYVKTQTLKPVLDLDLSPTEIFRVADELVAGEANLQIESYGREKTGLFVFTIISPLFSDVTRIATKAAAVQGVSDVFIRGAVMNTIRTNVTTTIVLNIDAIQSGTI